MIRLTLSGTVLLFYLFAIKTSTLVSATARTLYLQVDGGSENVNA